MVGQTYSMEDVTAFVEGQQVSALVWVIAIEHSATVLLNNLRK